jgi:hypothetical protein
MDTLPLPPRPDLGQYRKRAKELVAAARSGDDHAVQAWAREWLDAIVALTGLEPTPFVAGSLDRAVAAIERRVREQASRPGAGLTLADAQFLIASAHGFPSWAAFARQVERLSAGDDPFEAAADAVVDGELATLEVRVRADPALVRTRSARVHGATLLHYVAANGVEDFRQKTPPNAVAIARFLLASGAAVDALANTYDGGTAQTTLNLLVSSVHPAIAGLQPALVETLLDHGAAIDGLEDDGAPLMIAFAFGYPEAAETLARRGARVDNVVAAAALGRTDLVRRMLAEDGTAALALVKHPWIGFPADPRAQVERAFVWACAFGRTDVVELLLAHGVDPGVTDGDAMTGLHRAAGARHLEVVELLTARGAPLEARNRWGGTVLDSTVWFAFRHPAEAASYVPVLERLLAAGADVGAVAYPTGNRAVDEVLRRYGARERGPS